MAWLRVIDFYLAYPVVFAIYLKETSSLYGQKTLEIRGGIVYNIIGGICDLFSCVVMIVKLLKEQSP